MTIAGAVGGATVTTLYRMYDSSGNLLYVGTSNRPLDRKNQHKSQKPWWTEVATITLEHFDARREALVAEVSAIENERPRYNVDVAATSGLARTPRIGMHDPEFWEDV